MTDAQLAPTADDLFQKWKQFLEGGTDTTASIAAEHPHLMPAVQHLIDSYLATNLTGPASTLTGAAKARNAPSAPAIPGYTIEAFLGGGGMGEVWRVTNPLGRPFAMKVVRPDRLSSVGRERFLAEAKAMDCLNHPNVVPIRHYGIHDDSPYLLMPPYPSSLKDRMRDYQKDPRAAVKLLAAVAAGVGHLHANGFVHRDLKPGNVLLDENGQPAVSDFGLVKNLASDVPNSDPGDPASGSAETHPTGARGSKTLDGAVLGTRAYMSPEQAAGRINLANPRWDVWSLGVMLHELLVGVLPPSSADPAKLLEPNSLDNPPPSTWKRELDPGLDRVIRKCLARVEQDRYQNATEVANDLHRLLGVAGPRGKRIRNGSLIGACLLMMVVALAVVFHKREDTPKGDPPPPDLGSSSAEARADLLRQLKTGDPVTLVGDEGLPKYSRVFAARAGALPIEAGRVFSLNTQQPILVELIPPEAVLKPFKLTGEIQFIALASPAGRAGFFACHNPDIAAEGPDHTFLDWSYTEVGSPAAIAKPGEVTGDYALSLNHLWNPGSGQKSRGAFRSPIYQPFATLWQGPDKPYPWRKLELRVTPSEVYVTWGAGPAESITTERLDNFWRKAFNPRARPPFGPAGGVGIYLTQGSAALRNLTLTQDR